MKEILVILQIFIVLILVVLVFLQKNDDQGVANLSGGANENRIKFTGSKFMERATFFVALSFIVNSLMLARLQNTKIHHSKSIIDDIVVESEDTQSHKQNIDKHDIAPIVDVVDAVDAVEELIEERSPDTKNSGKNNDIQKQNKGSGGVVADTDSNAKSDVKEGPGLSSK